MKQELIWNLKMEGVKEYQINRLQVKDIKHSGVILVVDANTGRKVNFLLSDRVNSKLSQFVRNKKLEDFLFTNSNKVDYKNSSKRTYSKERVCFAE